MTDSSKISTALKLQALTHSPNQHEAENARHKLSEFLARHKITTEQLQGITTFRAYGWDISMTTIKGRHLRQIVNQPPDRHLFILAAACMTANGQIIDRVVWESIPKPAQDTIERAIIQQLFSY